MAKRRTLGEGLTPEEEEFLHGKSNAPQRTESQSEKKAVQITPEKSKVEAPKPAEPVVLPVQVNQHVGMVGLNTRVDPAISAALLRASVDRKIERKARAAVQDIVNEALAEWLGRAGYLTK